MLFGRIIQKTRLLLVIDMKHLTLFLRKKAYIMNKPKKIDMTKGSIVKLSLLFALPICIGNLLQQMYNTVDTIVVGNYCGSESLAAVGTSAQPVELLLCIFLGLGTGVSILVSQCTGNGDTQTLKKVVSTAITFLYICAIPLSILGIFIGPLILKIMQVPDDVFGYASAYVTIIFLGTLGNMGYNMNAGILRGLGDSRSSLLFLFISCVVNIVLDIVFVAGFHMDVTGVALATIIAMFCSWICSIIYIKKRYPELEFTWLPRRLDKALLKNVILVGLPLGLNNSLYSLGHIAMQSLINSQGSTFIAACSVAGKLTGLANIAITSLSSAATTFSGQNFGAKNYVRLKKGGLRIPLMSGAITCTAGIIGNIFATQILGIFTNDAAVLELAVHYIRIVLPFTWCYAVFNGIISYVNGMGKVRYTTVVNILMLWAVRIPTGYAITYFFEGIYCVACVPVSFVFGMICMLMYFFSKQWKEICKLAKEQTTLQQTNQNTVTTSASTV